MQDEAKTLVGKLPDNDHLLLFGERLQQWLVDDLNRSPEPVPEFTESRARALLRAANLLDEPTRHSFERLIENETAVRIALYDLLHESELAQNEAVDALVVTSAMQGTAESATVEWLSLAIAGFAWKSGYPLYQLDPATPPDPYSPAGQVLKRAAYYIRRQVQRSATDREKLGRQLVYLGLTGEAGARRLEDLDSSETIAPLPPHFRPPIPVRYPEVASETLHVAPGEEEDKTSVTRGDPITITQSDLAPEQESASYRQPIRISGEEQQPPSRTRVVTPDAAVSPRSDFSDSVRKKFGRGKQVMKATKLRVVVQEVPDGPGLYGLQVRVSCRGIKSYVAGTTNREGGFTCELPVPEHAGLTYDVDVTWPRDLGGETERKSITLNADRTQFILPFFRQFTIESGDKATS